MSSRAASGLPHMKLTVHTFITLDGTMQAPGGPDEDRRSGFDQGGWSAPYFDEQLGTAIDGWFLQADAFLFGRGTYEIFAAYWPTVTDPDDEVARLLSTLPKHVASRTLTSVDWDGAQLLQGDAVDAIRQLKSQPGGELQVHGSAGLIQTLLANDLIDELRLMIFPVVVAGGLKLFGDGAVPTALQLQRSEVSKTGVTIAVYDIVGKPTLGTYEVVDGKSTTIVE